VLATAFVVLVPIAVWMYTWVFALSSLWFGHYCLAALQALRIEQAATVVATPDVLPLVPDISTSPPTLEHDSDDNTPPQRP
jgi:hypothetical protein